MTRPAETAAILRNGSRPKTVLADNRAVEVAIRRDREGTLEPQIVRKRQRRLCGLDPLVISLPAKEVDPWRDLRAPGGGVRRAGARADHLHDHRPGD